jgi:hypothetical protein
LQGVRRNEFGIGIGVAAPNPPVQGQVLTNKKIYKPRTRKTAAEAIYVYRDRRGETKLYDAVVELVRLGTFNVSPDQVVKRVLLGDICIRNEDDQDVYYRAQVRAGSNSEYQRLEVRGTVAPTYPRKQRQAA